MVTTQKRHQSLLFRLHLTSTPHLHSSLSDLDESRYILICCLFLLSLDDGYREQQSLTALNKIHHFTADLSPLQTVTTSKCELSILTQRTLDINLRTRVLQYDCGPCGECTDWGSCLHETFTEWRVGAYPASVASVSQRHLVSAFPASWNFQGGGLIKCQRL